MWGIRGKFFQAEGLEGQSPELGPAWRFQHQKAKEQTSGKMLCAKDSKRGNGHI